MMVAAYYERQGPAEDVLVVGERPKPEPGAGEVRIALKTSGINPGDIKKRAGWLGSTMPYPLVIPHSDGAGVIDAPRGKRVWCFGAQSYRPFGTAAEFTTVPQTNVVELPDSIDDATAACLGIPGITAHRAVFSDGPPSGKVVLVQGATGAVGAMAAQLALWRGARVIGSVRRPEDADILRGWGIDPVLAGPDDDAFAASVRALSPGGVDRIIEVAFDANVRRDEAILVNGGTIAAYATGADEPTLPFWPLLFKNVTIRLLGSDDFPLEAKMQAARDLTEAVAQGALRVTVSPMLPLHEIVQAHHLVEHPQRPGRIVLQI